jgi:excisionase family DNA binding protein
MDKVEIEGSLNIQFEVKSRRGFMIDSNENAQAPKPSGKPQFLTVDELAEMLRVKPRTIYEMVSQGRIPYRKVGRRVVFLLAEILEWTNPKSRPGAFSVKVRS